MAYVTTVKADSKPNWLESEIGLITKTRQIPESMGTADGSRKTVFSGTAFPSNDASATGIVFTDTDVTDGDHAGSVMVAGRVLKERLNIESAAQSALEDLGIRFIEGPETER